ncbi:unnamed protein product [Lymnaea stagnalis]|uniref:Apolipoprotein E receptor n=1 Tax=Lymnaea stagnalis TaxID=6523 RepID=A0A6G7S6R9_LYMST|nr:apolipoprotein E receptor [Lymnaea stagnalis]
MAQLSCGSLRDVYPTWEVKTQYSLKSVKAIAKDWLSGNWYFADEFKEIIFFCTSDGSYCQTVLTSGIKRPKSLAVDASKGYLFYSDWSSNDLAHVGRIDLDGSNPLKLASIKIVHPNGLTADIANSHLYWGDSFLDVIERVDYIGHKRIVIAKGIDVFHVFGMSILQNYLYVVNHLNNTIVRIHRYNSTVPNKIMLKASRKPGTIKLFHPVAQPFEKFDVCSWAQCDQICVPVPNPVNDSVKASCVCKLGFKQAPDGKCTKQDATKFMLLTNGQQGMIHFISTDSSEVKRDLYPPIANLGRPTCVDFDYLEGYIYFFDVSSHTLRRRRFDSDKEPEAVVTQGINCDGLAVDWSGRNIYCSDSGRNKIVAISLRNFSHIYTVIDSDKLKEVINPKALAIDAKNGKLYWTDWVISPGAGNASINWVYMDGSNWARIQHKEIQWPNGLVLDPNTQMLYWTDAYYDRIESMSIDGTHRQVILNFTSNLHPFGITKHGNKLYWAESMDGSLMEIDLATKKVTNYRNSSAPVFDVKLYANNSQPNAGHPCSTNNGGCSDLCLLTPGGGAACKCADGRTSTNNGVLCTGKLTPGNIAPRKCQGLLEFECANGECIHSTRTCDGKFDCTDKSDEDMMNHTCQDEGMFKCNTSTCLYMQFKCDGEVDCVFGEDEKNCSDHSCMADHFQCATSKQCVPLTWKCDGEKDCSDGSDEDEAHCCKVTCKPEEFACLDGRCIRYEFRCDNEYDCMDNSDELDCQEWCDPVREFKCINESRCIPKIFQCDGEKNCQDGADEKGCEKHERICHKDEFSCSDGTCLKLEYKCDGSNDCLDGSDEINCLKNMTDKVCHWTEFKCSDGTQCIASVWRCDQEFDCKDKSDEKDCAKCQSPNFACKAHQTMCIPPEKLCDNNNDCPDYSDEGRLCEYDMCLNNDCEAKCHKSPDGFVCSCPENQKLRPDNKTCVDINSCEKWGICSQLCQPTFHGHKCYCSPGYTLQADGYGCKPIDPDPVYIIFANRHEIRRLNTHDKSMTHLVSNLQNAIALDFHYNQSLVFWTDVSNDKIYRGEINANSVTKIEPIIEFGLATTEGVAVDWIANTIYWVESNLDQIEVAKLDGSERATLIAGNMTSPRAIVLDPRVGKLFWTDWDGAHPRIESCSMAGEPETRTVVYDIRNQKGAGWPNGLAVDYETKRLYWVDARSDSIHCITYEGKDHQLILKSNRALSHPFSVTVFEHYIYWTDWRFNTLVVANKYNGSDVHVVHSTYQQPFDLQVYHPKRQPQMANPCLNSPCSHLCLIGDGLKPVCRCPHRYKLSDDKRVCEKDNIFLLFTKENEIRGVDLENAHYNVIPSITVPFVENATSIDYDVTEERLYWTDMKKNVITSAYLNGTGITTVIDSGLSNPSGFAIDWVSKNMYFSSYNDVEGYISVAKLDGAYRKEIYRSTFASKPNSIAIHPSKGVMFWSDLGGEHHTIWKANMDGKKSGVFVEVVKKPASLTLDMVYNRLYWISQEEGAIFWCDVSLSKCNATLDQNVSMKEPISMTLQMFTVSEQSYFMLTDSTLTKCSLFFQFQNGHKITMREDTKNVFDLRVYDPSSRQGTTNNCSVKNGGCEQLCLPTPDRGGIVCECTVGYQAVAGGKCHGIDTFILYTQASEIQGMLLDAQTHSPALASISKISRATSVDFHADNGHIYWVDSDLRLISRIKRDLSGREVIVSQGISGAESLAVDWIAGNIYWTDQGHNTIEVIRLNGSQRHVVLHEDIDKPRSIAVHPAKGYLYFANGGVSPKIVRTRLDGSERVDFVSSTDAQPVKAPFGLAIDFDTDDLYWCDKDLDFIERVTPSGQRFSVVTHNLTDCMSVAVHKDRLYWADLTDLQGSIKYVNKTGRDVTARDITVMKKNITKLKDIKVFDGEAQIGSNPCGENNGGCEELCLYRGNSNFTCACSYGRLKEDGKSCAEHDSFLLYSEITSLRSLILANSTDRNAPRHPIQNETYMKNVIGLAFDYATERIFFSDIQQGNIQAVFFNGTGFRIIKEGVGSAEGLAFDPLQKHLYWTSYSGSNINRISFNGLSPTKNDIFYQLDHTDHPRDIVVNSCIRRIFWTNWSDRRPSIQTSSYDSDGSTDSSESIITEGIRTPNGLTIDHKAQKLYWSDARLDKIERCDFDGSNRFIVVTSIPEHSFGLAVYGDFLYWTDWVVRAVVRANKYDGSRTTFLKKNINRQPMGIIAVANDTDDCMLNPCFENAFGCAEICVVSVKGDAMCQCGPGKKLLSDGKRCVSKDLENCDGEDFICEDNKLCIPFNKTCNDIPDCLDASDESNHYCSTRHCPQHWYQCQNSSRCIMNSRICDGRNDCGDGSDELNCPCAKNEFRCNNGMCILAKYKCDFDSDCPDLSDEIGCSKTCEDLGIHGIQHIDLVSCNTTSMCIYPNWICDGSNDCWDNNDEVNCDVLSGCTEFAFTCDDGKCILPQWKCDAEKDCADGSDEKNCTFACEPNQFECEDTICIPGSWVCDGREDCPDGKDEKHNCSLNCTDDQFKCPGGPCISKDWVCDTDPDCPNGEDERVDDIAKCSPVVCIQDQFTCLNRRCIKNEFFCDGDDDCGDNSDEPNMCIPLNSQCSENEFQCQHDLKCIQGIKRCNGRIDCHDHSDEKDCLTSEFENLNPCHNTSQFQCSNKMCINESLVCNGNDDCGDDSDEPSNCGINECHSRRPVCSQHCVDKKVGYECQCHPGYSFMEDTHDNVSETNNRNKIQKTSLNRKCIDVDECKNMYPCSHYCTNTIGSFKCSCADGYSMLGDGRSCVVADGIEVQLLVSNRYYLRLIGTTKNNVTTFTSELKNSVAVDYDWKDQMVYWSDITNDRSSISRMGFNFTSKTKTSDTENLHTNTVRNPDGLAVDWVGRNLYWCDKTTDTIEVSRLDGKYRKVLLRQQLQEPRALEVFPQKGLLFFTDWGNNPHISRMNMDGTNLMQIVNTSIAWPNALTIDYVTEKVFWGDGSLDYIGMADLDGSNFRYIIKDNNKIPHVFALGIFEGLLYWTDWEKSSVLSAAKFSGNNITRKKVFSQRPMDIQVVHPLRQTAVLDKYNMSPCDYQQCTHLCLLRPGENGVGVQAVCACPESHYLANDSRSCISNCTSSQILCSSTSKCIPFWWKCDNRPDCEDGSDEPKDECGAYHCSHPGMFQCTNATSARDCLLPTQICDGTQHCHDGSDENICAKYTCMEHYAKCHADNTCIPKFKVCDGHPDCSDKEDENNCEQVDCNPEQFKCANSRCVPYVWKCDNDDDCGDGSDEPEDCKTSPCPKDFSKCNVTGKCIPENWKCDGDYDCGDQDTSDEDFDECHSQTCDPTFFKCHNGHCIPGRWKCDFHDDCRDGSDEQNCNNKTCSSNEFRCGHGKCIPKPLTCNGVFDCWDNTDEINCSLSCDSTTEFQCKNVPHCIAIKWLCDGESDCADNSDEKNCERNCTEKEFKCKNTQCKPRDWQCDGDDDCGDNSDEDEQLCAQLACPPGRFRCKRHKCIWNNMVCNNVKDCPDGEDEDITQCAIAKECTRPSFLCDSLTKCVHQNQMCDDVTDCVDGSDEDKAFCDSLKSVNCSVRNGGCEHHCNTTSNGAKCSCKKNYILNEDSKSCSFDNPCNHYNTCSQLCHYNKDQGLVECSCAKGFTRAEHSSCFATGTEPVFLLAEKGTVVLRYMVDFDQTETIIPKMDNKNKHIVSIDMDISQNIVFFINQTGTEYFLMKSELPKNLNKTRRKRQISNKPPEILHLQDRQLFEMGGLAVDWVTKHVYLTDVTNRQIHVFNYNAERGKVVARQHMSQPYAIAVDPIKGYIFWTDRGVQAKIERANLDGSERTTIVSSEISWPNGITLDTIGGWVYWTDTKKHTVEVAKYDGSRRQKVFVTSDDPPFAVDFFEDYLYIVTYKTSQVIKVHKFKQFNSTLFTTLSHASDLRIIQDNKQQKVSSNCTGNPCEKTEICFNKAQDVKGFICLCPDGAQKNGNSCDYEKPPGCENYCKNGRCELTKVTGKPKCICEQSYFGEQCETHSCQGYCLNGNCTPSQTPNTPPICRCLPGFSGERCEKYACTSYCQNGGVCRIIQGQPHCFCPLLYDGVRCENQKPEMDWCSHICKNGGQCIKERFGYIRCNCTSGFTGQRCEQCVGLTCANGGTCFRDATTKQAKCECLEGFDSRTNCANILNCSMMCTSGVKLLPEQCDCNCKPTYFAANCRQCPIACPKNQVCFTGSGKPNCECDLIHDGPNCERCKCETTGLCSVDTDGKPVCNCSMETFGPLCQYGCVGSCGKNGRCSECYLKTSSHHPQCMPGKCICYEGFSGPTCAAHTEGSKEQSTADTNPLMIAVPIAIALIVIAVIVILIFVMKRRNRRSSQYGHKRMDERGGNMNVTNPVYMRRDAEDDEEDECEPLSGGAIFTGDTSSNFASPMYNGYSNDSTQKLLSSSVTEEHNTFNDGDVVFAGSTRDHTEDIQTTIA